MNICNSLLFGSRRWVGPPMKVKVKVAQSCPTLCNPMDCKVYGILQARKLEWVVFPFSRGFSQPREGDINQWQRVFDGYTSQLPHLSAGIVPRYGLHVPGVPGQNTPQLLKVMTSLITCPLLASFLSHPASSFHHQCFLGSSPKNITSTSGTFPLEKK